MTFAWLFPQDWRNTDATYVAFALTAFLVLTLSLLGALLLAGIAVLAACRRRWRLALVAALPAIVILGLTASRSVGGWINPPPDPTRPPISVVSVNLLMVNRTTQPIVDEILAADADVVCVQEFTLHWREALDAALADRYPHYVGVTQEDSFGAAIYSKRPFAEPPATALPTGRVALPQLRAVVEHDSRRVAIYNVHLLPPRTLGYTINHRVQFADLVDLLAADPLPLIVAGDFNFTELTPNAAAFRRVGLTDAWEQRGVGIGATWPVIGFMRYLPVPGLRLDHVFVSRDLAVDRVGVGVGRHSDHRPIRVDVRFVSGQAR
jgi:endonuclease/exonuclease/phosphatase (EEP) superfamily protein YafD